MRPLVPCALALALTGCLREEMVEPTSDAVAVHALAVVGDIQVNVAMSRTSALFLSEPIVDAAVELHRGGASYSHFLLYGHPCVDDDADDGTVGCYVSPSMPPLQAGETIALDIALADGTRLRGETTLPTPPQVLQPTEGAALEQTLIIYSSGLGFDIEPIQVAWDDGGVEGQATLEVVRLFRNDSTFRAPCAGGPSRLTRSPATVVVPNCVLMIEEMWDSMEAVVHVAAYDDAFREYSAAFNETAVGVVYDRALAGLEVIAGDRIVAGVFGSASVTRVGIMIHLVVEDRRPSGNPASGAPARGAGAP